ncbi:MAG: PadR family transcriptional regulator, partial [Acetatifactor sp.]|nr:PadR family transcriptional regulator [Acetatifactor sp.]
VYSLTEQGEIEFERLMLEIASKSINFYLDFNAVIVNLDSLPAEHQQTCLTNIEDNIQQLKAYLEENLSVKQNAPDVPENGMAVLRQQIILTQAIETWISSLKETPD